MCITKLQILSMSLSGSTIARPYMMTHGMHPFPKELIDMIHEAFCIPQRTFGHALQPITGNLSMQRMQVGKRKSVFPAAAFEHIRPPNTSSGCHFCRAPHYISRVADAKEVVLLTCTGGSATTETASSGARLILDQRYRRCAGSMMRRI